MDVKRSDEGDVLSAMNSVLRYMRAVLTAACQDVVLGITPLVISN